MDYLVYIRLEDNPSDARRHVLAAERAGGAQYVLDARYEATPGDETAMLHEAFDATFGLNKYISLYRGFPVGQDVRGHKLFTPVGLVWCKDRADLGQMLGLEMSYENQENFAATGKHLENDHPEAEVHSPWSQGGAKRIDWTRPTRIQDGRDWNSKWLENSPTDEAADVSGSGAHGERTPDGGSHSGHGGNEDLSDDGARRSGRNLFAPNPPEFDPEAAARAEWNQRNMRDARHAGEDISGSEVWGRGDDRNGRETRDRRDEAKEREALRGRDVRSARERGASEGDSHRDDGNRRSASRVKMGGDDQRARSPWAARSADAYPEASGAYADDDRHADADGKPKGRAGKWLLAFIVCLVGSFLLVYLGARWIAG